MKQFFTVLKFELGNYFKNKSFVAATVVLAVILAAVITVPTLFMGNGSGSSQGEDGGGEAAGRKVLAVADESGSIADEESFASYLPEYQVTFCDGEESVRTMVEEEEAAAGFLVTGADSYEYILKNRSMMSDYQEPLRRHWPGITGRLPWSSWELTRRRWRMYTPFPCSHRRWSWARTALRITGTPIYWYFSCIF